MAPVEVSKLSPAGSDGETDHETTAPPPADGVTADIVTPFVNVNGLPV